MLWIIEALTYTSGREMRNAVKNLIDVACKTNLYQNTRMHRESTRTSDLNMLGLMTVRLEPKPDSPNRILVARCEDACLHVYFPETRRTPMPSPTSPLHLRSELPLFPPLTQGMRWPVKMFRFKCRLMFANPSRAETA